MLRIRTGARDGLRWGLFGFVAAVLTLSNNSAQAAPYADIVVDANSGAVLHATNPDARRHPASLTKIMTLYLLFEQLEAGKLKLDSALKVSTEASAQAPTKLGLKPATTLSVEDAIKGMVTRSANDAAVVVAEAIAGNESEFAKVMTRKAHALGMKNTVYKNASGLPDDNQVTTARDQSILGRAIQDRFPRYYKYFSIRSFTFRGQTITNHNRLLGKVDGVDGIKTGYINASGFNLVTSVHRGNRYLVAVVMGGNTGASRDTRMRELINEKIVQASIKRTSPMVAEATPSEPVVVAKAEPKPEPMVVVKVESKPEPMPVAKAEPKPEPKVGEKIEAKAEPKAEAKTEHRYAVASAISMPARLNPAAAPTERSEPPAAATPTQARWVVGSTEPIQPVLVKTLTVRAATKTPSLIPLQVAAGATEPQPAQARAPAAVVLAKAEVAVAPPPAPAAVAKPETSTPVPPPVAAKPEPPVAAKPEPPVAAKPEPPAPAIIAKSEPTSPAPAAAAKAEPSPSNVTATKPESPAPVQKASAPADATNPDAAPAAAPATSKPPSSPVAIPVPRPAAAPANPPAPAAKTAAAAAKPQHRPGWMIQVGAYPAEQAAKERLSAVQSKASKILTGAEAFTETVDKGGTTLYRARFAGLDKDAAEAACKYLKKNDVECVTIKN
ncbi:MAG TPA: D-alanyl-D-alanine carboxypeptidase [Xanthobacteraceae bacterium]|nr:D-alanyl-D-alanine carboxypeptidase [Xanthobacteraceae bacterium]